MHQVSGRSKEVFQHPSSCCRSYHLQLLKQVGHLNLMNWRSHGLFRTQRHLKGCSLFLDTALCQLQGTFNLEGNKNSREWCVAQFRFIWKVKIKQNKTNIPSKGPQLFKSLIKPPPSVVDFVSLVADVAAAPLPVALAIVEPPSAIVPQQDTRKLF